VLRRRLDRAKAKTDLAKQLRAYQLSAEILTAHGHPEYTFAYFGAPICLADLSYYQMKLDWIGFGSGAFSVLDGRIKGYVGGKLHKYIDDPTEFDYDVSLSEESQAVNLIGFALTTPDGVDAAVYQERTGTSLWTALEYPEVKDYLGQLCQFGTLITDDAGIRFDRADIAKVFISMNWIEPPEAKPAPAPVELGMPAPAAV
jgi:coproporphyrinogen III oxidase-like Fe-S oxidoreductase